MAKTYSRPHDRNAFKIAVICALPLEAEMVLSIFDRFWDHPDKSYGKVAGDQNAYTTGMIGNHNVVLAHMPGMGGNKAATVAQGLRSSYRRIEVAFVVGVCGVVPIHPQTKEEIVLGDCIISTAVVQYDFGRQYPQGFVRKNNIENSLERANLEIRSLMAMLITTQNMVRMTERLVHHMAELQKTRQGLRYPGTQRDHLFPSSYIHQHRLRGFSEDPSSSGAVSSEDCESIGCEEDQLVQRYRLRISETVSSEANFFPSRIHFGRFGSANTVMKSGLDRDRIAEKDNLVAFEMEGSGVWDSLPTIVIKSACDYADSHKNKEWQPYAAATAAAGLKVLLERWEVTDEPLNHGNRYDVPFSIQGVPVTKQFIDRPSEMKNLRDTLLSNSKIRRKIFVLSGLGGIGKTQLAVEFVRSHKSDFTAVFWLDGSSEDSLKQSIARCASQISSDQISKEGETDAIVREMLNWFTYPENNKWLIIFDNVDREFTPSDPQSYDINAYIPSVDHGSILITTRLIQLGQLGEAEEVKKVDERVAQAILRSWYKKSYDEDEGKQLLGYLDGLPLAIAQAGAYLQESGMNLKTYLQLYQEKSVEVAELLHGSNESLHDYPGRSVWTTWIISYDTVLARNKHAAYMLVLWSFLDRSDLWYGLFEKAIGTTSITQVLSKWFGSVVSNKPSFIKAMALLRSYSLIEGSEETDGYVMHAVVHRWVYLYQGLQHSDIGRLALTVVGLAVPMKTERHYAQLQKRLLPHAQACFGRALGLQVGVAEDLTSCRQRTDRLDQQVLETELGAFNNLGILYRDQGKLAEAEKMYTRALEGKEEALGPKHTSTLDTVNNLGILYRDQGKLAEAEKMYTRALEGSEEALGPKHTSTLDTVNNLGLVYWDQGKLAEAEKMYMRALEGKEEALGPKHTSTLDTVNNLGILYRDQGKLAEAEKMHMRALEGKEEALGPKHISTLDAVNNLGILYRNQGKLAEAEKMYTRALEGSEEALGPKHISTLHTVNNLGLLYGDQGKLEKAEDMYMRALQGKEEALGAKHTSTLDIVNNLGILYSDQGKLEKAEDMYMRALQGNEEALGPKHTSTLQIVNNLGLVYWDQGKLAEAEELYMRALEGREEALGPKHTSTLDTVNNLGIIYRDQGKLAEAEKMYTRALEGREEALGPKHTSALDTVNNLGLLYKDQGKLAEAEKMYQRALQGYEEALGVELVKTYISALETMSNLGDLYSATRPDGSQAMYERALSGYTIVRGGSSDICLDLQRRLDALDIS